MPKLSTRAQRTVQKVSRLNGGAAPLRKRVKAEAAPIPGTHAAITAAAQEAGDADAALGDAADGKRTGIASSSWLPTQEACLQGLRTAGRRSLRRTELRIAAAIATAGAAASTARIVASAPQTVAASRQDGTKAHAESSAVASDVPLSVGLGIAHRVHEAIAAAADDDAAGVVFVTDATAWADAVASELTGTFGVPSEAVHRRTSAAPCEAPPAGQVLIATAADAKATLAAGDKQPVKPNKAAATPAVLIAAFKSSAASVADRWTAVDAWRAAVGAAGPTVFVASTLRDVTRPTAPANDANDAADATKTPALTGPSHAVSVFVAAGAARFQLLVDLVRGAVTRSTHRALVVHVAAPEIADFLAVALFTVGPTGVTILCDGSEGDAAGADADLKNAGKDAAAAKTKGGNGNADGKTSDFSRADGYRVGSAQALGAVTAAFEAAAGAGEAVVLLSAFHLLPPAGDALVQYDVPSRLEDMPAVVAEAKRIGAARAAAKSAPGTPASGKPKAVGRKRGATPPPSAAATTPGYAQCVLIADPAWARAACRHVTQRAAALASTKQEAPAPSLAFTFLKPPGAGAGFLAAQSLREKAADLFVLNNKAYEAYRALMRVHAAPLHPTSVFELTKLDLDQQAQQFGLESAPLLDLRTKATRFRPKEDILKAAKQVEKRAKIAERNVARAMEPEDEDLSADEA